MNVLKLNIVILEKGHDEVHVYRIEQMGNNHNLPYYDSIVPTSYLNRSSESGNRSETVESHYGSIIHLDDMSDRSYGNSTGPDIYNSESISLCSWNIEGLNDDKFCILESVLNQYHIILLSETWCHMDNIFHLPGYTFVNYARRDKHPGAIRMSGSIAFFIRNELKDGIQIGKHYKDNVAWIILQKELFGLQNDLIIGNVYLVPEESSHESEDLISALYAELKSIPSESRVLLCGDYNARTGGLDDVFIEEVPGNDGDLVNLLPNGISIHCNTIHSMYKMAH